MVCFTATRPALGRATRPADGEGSAGWAKEVSPGSGVVMRGPVKSVEDADMQ